MNKFSRKTLGRIKENDSTLDQLQIGRDDVGAGVFNSIHVNDFSRLGKALATNKHVKMLHIHLYNLQDIALASSNSEFYNGLKQNSSISLALRCRSHRNALDEFIDNGIAHEIFRVYQQNNNLSYLSIARASNSHILQNGGNVILATALSHNTKLKKIYLQESNITNEQLLPMVEAMRGLLSLETLDLNHNRIGNTGCEAISTLLSDPNSSLCNLDLRGNQINNEGANTIINSLANNTKLQLLNIGGNPTTHSIMQQSFSRLLCNTSSLNGIYNSNHTLTLLDLIPPPPSNNDSLRLNNDRNKSQVAIRKILKYHPNIDMEQLFEFGSEGELSLKALPYVIHWFNRAGKANEPRNGYYVRIFRELGYEKIVSRLKPVCSGYAIICAYLRCQRRINKEEPSY